ncbi:MAG: class I SAM-dependent methyltransferase [Bacteroidota bacterium]|nr:class I SAM-dependent methyltransferase [Bacteroidota bacterium]
MTRFLKLFKALSAILRQPALLNKVLDDTDLNKEEVIKKYQLPRGLKTVEIMDLLPVLDLEVEPFGAMEGGSTPIDLALLKGLASLKSGCHYFEIGTWRGESVANVASVAEHCVTLNLPDEHMLKTGMPPSYVALHRFFSQDLKNVTHLEGNSLTYDYQSLKNKFDLVFVDGDHHYESVRTDTKNAFTLLKDAHSVIVWHDYGNDPSDIRWDVLRGILDGTPAEKQKYLYRVSNTLCAIYTEQPLSSRYPDPFSQPLKHFSVKVSAKKRL